ncbi:Transcription factor fungi [Macrophomina phaseolina MS6]|uniref:Transcription factor fungi n=1 Tax=Macrophomina phaseolina (strain MS6) TaxID=1126212 RepID=K2RYP1_MACPH|nr:Transcription factor fungi [Macrophomina phaseolina MS6]
MEVGSFGGGGYFDIEFHDYRTQGELSDGEAVRASLFTASMPPARAHPQSSPSLDLSHNDSAQSCRPGCSLQEEILFADVSPDSEGEGHPLDHKPCLGPDVLWSKEWESVMCCDTSTLGPLVFLDAHMEDRETKKTAALISNRLLMKVKQSASDRGSSGIPQTLGGPETQHCDNFDRSIQAFFAHYHWYSPFVKREEFELGLRDFLICPANAPVPLVALIHGVLAIGSTLLSQREYDAGGASTVHPSTYMGYFREGLRQWERLKKRQPSVMKAQALTALLIFASRLCDTDTTRALLTDAAHTLRLLGFYHSRTATPPAHSEEEAECLRTIFWIVYSIEKPFAMRFGLPMMIDDDFIALPPPVKRRGNAQSNAFIDNTGWEVIRYRYARLCALIVKALYSRNSLRQSPQGTLRSLASLHKTLESWRESLPGSYQSGSPTHGADRIRLEVTLQYLEAMMAIHRWAVWWKASIPTTALSQYSSSVRESTDAAKDVLRLTQTVEVHHPDLDWPLIHIPLLATTILFIAVIKPNGNQSDLAYLGLACGLFGRLATNQRGSFDFFADVNHISALAHRILYTSSGTSLPSSISSSYSTDILDSPVDTRSHSNSVNNSTNLFPGGPAVHPLSNSGATGLLTPDDLSSSVHLETALSLSATSSASDFSTGNGNNGSFLSPPGLSIGDMTPDELMALIESTTGQQGREVRTTR